MKPFQSKFIAFISLLLLCINAKAQTPAAITGTVTTTSAICSGTGSISVNLATGTTPYNLVNSNLSTQPVGATVGGENYTPTFTSGNPHYVQLTPPENVKRGYIAFAATSLKPVAFDANFGLYVGNGTGADGTAFSYGKVNTSAYTYGEAGMVDSGLVIGFHDYTNKIKIYYNNVELQSYNVNGTLNNSGWKSVFIEITTSGQLTLAYGGNTYCTNYQLPTAYVTCNKNNWQYGFSARCGGLNNLHAINDVVIRDKTPMQYSSDGTSYTTSNTITNLNPGTYNVYARIGDSAYNSHGYNSTASLGTQTITALSVTGTLTRTNPTTCTGTGTIAISNVTHNFVPYDLVNVSLTNGQLGAASVGNLGTCCNPFFGAGDLVLTPPTSSRAGYIAFNSTVAQPNAFSANYDVFVGGGNGGDGLSFNYGVLNTSGSLGGAESGMVNSGLAIGFSDYSNTIKIFYNKIELQSYSATVNSGSYKSVAITVTQDGKVTIVHGGITICSNYQLPAAYATDNKSNWQYALAARCGASNNYHSVKNVVIKDNDIQYSANGQTWTSATTLTGLATGNYTIIARQSNGAYCPNASQVGTTGIFYTPDITATVSSTSPTTCTTEGGTITISNVSHGLSSPYDLVNASLASALPAGATVGGLGTANTPYFGVGDLVLTPPTSSRAGYVAFATTVATPNAFSANYDVFVGGGNGGDGLSFNYGVLNTSSGGEAGMVNSGLAIGFIEYSNTIKIYYNTTELQSYSATLNSGGSYKSVAITVTQDGKLTIVYGGITICSNYQLPAAYATDSKSSWKYALAARCGASNNYHSVKNVVIKDNSIQYTINGTDYTENPNFTNVYQATYNVRARISNGAYCSAISTLASVTIAPPPGMIAITGQPSTTNQTVAQTATATTLSVTATGAATISYHWLSNTGAYNNGGNPIVGANSASYTPPTSAVGTLYYYCVVSNACSEVRSALSGSVTVTPCTSTTSSSNITICTSQLPYSWNGLTFAAAGTQTAHLTNAAGCDSAASLTVTISPAPNAFNYDRYGDPTYELVKGQGYQNILPENVFAIAYGYDAYGVAVDTAGNVFVSDYDNDVIKKIDKNGNETTFYSTGIKKARGLATDKAGNVYVTNQYYNKVLKISPSGSLLNTYSGFNNPRSVAVDTAGNIYVADNSNNAVKKISTNGTITVIGSGFVYPEAVAVDATGNIYVGDFSGTSFAGRVKKMATNGTISVLATGFDDMSSIAVDANNNVYVADGGNSNGVIKVIAPNGTVSTLGSGLGYPTGVALDASGNVYVADDNYEVDKIITGGGAVSNYSISPSLPAGLSLNTTTGEISGTPTVASAATDYTVTAHSCGGTATALVNIAVLLPTNIWAGGTGNFNVPSNWSLGTVPQTIENIQINSGNPKLDINLTVGGTMTIAGTGSLTINPGKTLSISGTADFGGKLVTVKSDATGSGSIGQITGTLSNATNVTVERYIITDKRAWRLLTIPVTGQSIRNYWAGTAANPAAPAGENPGSGTLITGHGYATGAEAAAAGFDWFTGLGTSTTSSINYYANDTWNSATNTPNILSAPTKQGYLLYVRGDRTVANAVNSSNTTLRPTGTLKTGNQTIPVNDTYEVVGNPYASNIDLDAVYNNGTNNAKIERNFWLWDATQGGYGGFRSLSWDGSAAYDMSGGTGNAADYLQVQSGQAFFVQTKSPGSISISEGNKISGSSLPPVFFASTINGTIGKLNANLYTSTAGATAIDGVTVRLNNDYDRSPFEPYDAPKLNNLNENLSIVRDGRYLGIESRPYPTATDTIYLSFWNLAIRDYVLKIKGTDLGIQLQSATLIDRYTQQSTALNLTGTSNDYGFSITANANSSLAGRFIIVLKTSTVVPLSITKLAAQAKTTGIELSWQTMNEINVRDFDVERSTDGISFKKMGNVSATNGTAVNEYQLLDNQPATGWNYYRLRSNDANGQYSYSATVKALWKATASIRFYPTISKDGKLQMELQNQPAGEYLVVLSNIAGADMYRKMVAHAGATGSYTLQLQQGTKKLAAGEYVISVYLGNAIVGTQKIIIQ